jgi:uncharacterized Rmd1/YagE family protein
VQSLTRFCERLETEIALSLSSVEILNKVGSFFIADIQPYIELLIDLLYFRKHLKKL